MLQRMVMRGSGVVVLAGLAGCGPVIGGIMDGGAADSDSTGAIDPTEPGTTVPDPTVATTVDPSTSTSTSTSSTTDPTDPTTDDGNCGDTCGCCNFICPGCDDGATDPPWECDLFAQDCPDGEKCMPWANDGGVVWNASRCSPDYEADGQLGDTCLVEGSGVSGIDDCDVGLVCLWVDPATLTGTCVSLCGGSSDDPSCVDPDSACFLGFDGALPVCLPTCDPLAPQCLSAGGCYPTETGFVCGDTLPEPIAVGEPCEYEWSCAPGSFCVAAEALPECAATACCTAYCDSTVAESCGPERICVPIHGDGSAAGFCTTP